MCLDLRNFNIRGSIFRDADNRIMLSAYMIQPTYIPPTQHQAWQNAESQKSHQRTGQTAPATKLRSAAHHKSRVCLPRVR